MNFFIAIMFSIYAGTQTAKACDNEAAGWAVWWVCMAVLYVILYSTEEIVAAIRSK